MPVVNPITRFSCNCCWGVRGAPARGFRLSARVYARECVCTYVCAHALLALSAVSGGQNNLEDTSVSNLESAQTQRCPGRSQADLENVLEVLSLRNRHSSDRSLRPSGLRTSWMSKALEPQLITREVREMEPSQVLVLEKYTFCFDHFSHTHYISDSFLHYFTNKPAEPLRYVKIVLLMLYASKANNADNNNSKTGQ